MIPLSTLEVHALKVDLKTKVREIFTKDEVTTAVKQFLSYGEESFNPHGDKNISGHRGYFSEYGWAARALRYLHEQLSEGGCICDGKK